MLYLAIFLVLIIIIALIKKIRLLEILVYGLCFLAMTIISVVITVVFKIRLGAIPTVILYALTYALARFLCTQLPESKKVKDEAKNTESIDNNGICEMCEENADILYKVKLNGTTVENYRYLCKECVENCDCTVVEEA